MSKVSLRSEAWGVGRALARVLSAFVKNAERVLDIVGDDGFGGISVSFLMILVGCETTCRKTVKTRPWTEKMEAFVWQSCVM